MMIEIILAQEKELCKIRDKSDQRMAKIYSRASIIATLLTDDNKIKAFLSQLPPPIEGILGEFFHFHMIETLHFFLENEPFKRVCAEEESLDRLIALKVALLVPLRQTIGSCFATAFLIHLQKTDLATLFNDLYKTSMKKVLTRVIDQKEVRIPQCIKTGRVQTEGVFIASPLMKSYEYTVAALADVQVGFSRWNFFSALGLDNTATGGLGKVIYGIIEKKVKEKNEEQKDLISDIEFLEQSLDFDDAAFKAASSIDRMNSIKQSAKIKQLYLDRKITDYEEGGKKNKAFASLYPFFIEQYGELFPHYFQELYDPEMAAGDNPFEDQAAGFRLVYKHGRSDSRVWTYIYTDQEYIAAIREFIVLTETILINLKRGEGLEKVIETIVSEILLAIDTKEFIEEQKQRVHSMHQTYLKREGNTSPYAYISGGNIESLIKSYYCSTTPLRKEKISAQTPKDLCYSLIEWMKDAKDIEISAFDKDPFKGFILTNEIHACNFLPGMEMFKKGWMDVGNTYSYMRDHFPINEPIVFADTNWGGFFLAFIIDPSSIFSLVLFDGSLSYPFNNWDFLFKKESYWEIYIQ
jgi:hypothetical protein